MEAALSRINQALAHGHTEADLVQPLLQVLEWATRFDSTYLTRIDMKQGVQTVLYSHNARELYIPQGVHIELNQTLCHRALQEQTFFVNNVPQHWPGTAADALGIQTYLSTPVTLRDGSLFGTLCAASQAQHPAPPFAPQLMALIAQLIAQRVEREQLVTDLQRVTAVLQASATTDPLTGLPNRRALVNDMHKLFEVAKRQARWVMVGFLDLDGFKAINDLYGHACGDLFLKHIGAQLQATRRDSDTVGRLGGDEFLLLGLGPALHEAHLTTDACVTLQTRLSDNTQGAFQCNAARFDYPGASVGVVAVSAIDITPDEAIRLADAEMYRIKAARKKAALQPSPTRPSHSF